MKKFGFLILILVIITGCVAPLLAPTEFDANRAVGRNSNSTLASLQEGHALYKLKCGSCHFLYRPNSFTLEKWDKIMPDMKKEAGLTEQENLLLVQYITAMHDAPVAR